MRCIWTQCEDEGAACVPSEIAHFMQRSQVLLGCRPPTCRGGRSFGNRGDAQFPFDGSIHPGFIVFCSHRTAAESTEGETEKP